MILVSDEGTIYNIDNDGNCEAIDTDVDGVNSDDNSYHLSVHSSSLLGYNGKGFGASDNAIVTRHRVRFDGQYSPIIILL